MSVAEDVKEITPFKGMRYKKREWKVDAANEARLMGLCRIDPAVFKGCSDPSAFISFAIQEGVLNGISSNGGVNMVQGLVQHRPLARTRQHHSHDDRGANAPDRHAKSDRTMFAESGSFARQVQPVSQGCIQRMVGSVGMLLGIAGLA